MTSILNSVTYFLGAGSEDEAGQTACEVRKRKGGRMMVAREGQ